MIIDANTTIQTLLGALLTIQLVFLTMVSKRQGSHEKSFNQFKDNLSNEFVPRNELIERQKRIEDMMGLIQSDMNDTKQCLRAIEGNHKGGLERIHEKLEKISDV